MDDPLEAAVRALGVGVVHAQHEHPARATREQVVGHGGHRRPEVQRAGGRRGEADADVCHQARRLPRPGPALASAAVTEERLTGALLDWYAAEGRDLPWRHTRDPYAILVSEVMLQQTQVARVLERWTAWLERWPTVEALAAASTADVVRAWSGLGYNRRAVNLQRAARAVVERGGFPRTPEGLQELPGVGPYTASAVACFAFDAQLTTVDVNARRVFPARSGATMRRRRPAGRARGTRRCSTSARRVCLARIPRCERLPARRRLPLARAALRARAPPGPVRGLVAASGGPRSCATCTRARDRRASTMPRRSIASLLQDGLVTPDRTRPLGASRRRYR